MGVVGSVLPTLAEAAHVSVYAPRPARVGHAWFQLGFSLPRSWHYADFHPNTPRDSQYGRTWNVGAHVFCEAMFELNPQLVHRGRLIHGRFLRTDPGGNPSRIFASGNGLSGSWWLTKLAGTGTGEFYAGGEAVALTRLPGGVTTARWKKVESDVIFVWGVSASGEGKVGRVQVHRCERRARFAFYTTIPQALGSLHYLRASAGTPPLSDR
jgi:hypothetical protein